LRLSTFILILSAILHVRVVPGSLRGRVTDGSGTAVTGAVVAAITGQGQIKVGITDAHGEYTIGDLSPGKYTIWAGGNGYHLYENTSLGVRAGRSQTLDICLRSNPESSSADRLEMAKVRQGSNTELISDLRRHSGKLAAFAPPCLLSLVGLLT
jgi:hypothetical protein